MCIWRLTLAWISCEISTTHEECWLILTGLPSLWLNPISSDWCLCCPVSTGHSRHPSPTLLWVPLSNSRLAFSSHFRSRRDRGLRPLFGFAPKQTKGSSAWWTTYIVLQTAYCNNASKNYSLTDTNGFRISKSKTRCVHFCQLRKIHNDPLIKLDDTTRMWKICSAILYKNLAHSTQLMTSPSTPNTSNTSEKRKNP